MSCEFLHERFIMNNILFPGDILHMRNVSFCKELLKILLELHAHQPMTV